MHTSITLLISALRHELEQYGEMLALFERQQKQIAARSAEEVFQSIAPIKTQGVAIQRARAQRDRCRSDTAVFLHCEIDATFVQILPLLPLDCRPLVGALVKENNELLRRVRQKARQNHLHLSRSIELMQGLINSLFPSSQSKTYNGCGSMKLRRPTPRALYEAVG